VFKIDWMDLFLKCIFVSVLVLVSAFVHSQSASFDELEGADIRIYKVVEGDSLKLSIVYPENFDAEKKYPAIIFFFGGGWRRGTVQQFAPHCNTLAGKGMIAIAANYRVQSRNNSTPFDAVADAKSAMRYLRRHACEIGIAGNKIVAAGGSAGGHLAACTALIACCNAPDDDLTISPVPNALILFNPVINTMPEGYGSERLGERAKSISPAHHVVEGAPPTLIFHGLDDKTVPFSNVKEFQGKMTQAGNACKVVSFSDAGHGFFNFGRNENRYFNQTMEEAVQFLQSLQYLK
jgi:acetyl esterase